MADVLTWMHDNSTAGVAVCGGLLVALLLYVLYRAARRPKGRHAPVDGRRPNAHRGADEKWSPKREILTAPPAPRVDPKVLLAEAEEELAKAAARVDACRQAVIDDENARWHAAFAEFERTHRDKVQRAGHLELHTVEVTKDQLAKVLGGGQ